MSRKAEASGRPSLGRVRRLKPLLPLVTTAVLISTFLMFYSGNSIQSKQMRESSQSEIPPRDPTIWISMSLCWSRNAEVYKKAKFPYREAAKLSTKLWKNKTDANVLMKIVHEEVEPPDEMNKYVEAMRGEGVEVMTERSRSLNCVLEAQLARMYAFKEERVQDKDIVMVIDVDAFIVSKRVLEPLKEDYRVWIYRYAMTKDNGWTFNMNFIAMRAQDWRYVLDLTDLGVQEITPDSAVNYFNDTLRFKSDTERWEIDQVILSHGILRHNLCSLPLDNPLWKHLQLEPRTVDDNKVCYHGDSMDCQRDRKTMKGGCTWWHFHPDEGKLNLNRKFRELMKQ